MKRVFVIALGLLAGCSATTMTSPPLGDDCTAGTCDESGDDSSQEWYVEECAEYALTLTDDQKAAMDSGETVMFGSVCKLVPPGYNSNSVFHCAGVADARSPSGYLIAAEVEECDTGDGTCAVEEGGAVCHDCSPDETSCQSSGGIWGVYRCSGAGEWELDEECGPDSGSCIIDYTVSSSPFCD